MAKIPDKKHTRDELSRMRAHSAMQSNNSPVVDTYNKQLAGKPMVILGYILPLVTIIWWFVKKAKAGQEPAKYEMSDFCIMTIPIVLALLVALWIALKKVLSRHNSAFICILCLFCCFPIFTVVNSNPNLQADLLALIGKDLPVANDPLLDNDSNDGATSQLPTSPSITDAEREEMRLYTEQLKREQAESLRQKASEEGQ